MNLVRVILVVLCFSTILPAQFAEKHLMRAPKTLTNLYPDGVDARKEIQEALTRARATHKRVLLVFGANWCYDCHVLDLALHEPEVLPSLQSSFELVHVNIGRGEKNIDLLQKYHNSLERGVPTLSIVTPEGKVIYSSLSGEFEAARRMYLEDLVTFLNKWKETKPN